MSSELLTHSTDCLVSVIIPTYNRYSLLLRAIQSVQKQTHSNVEIIVINDCSTESEYYSGELEKLDKVIVIHLPENQRKVYNATAAQGKTRQFGLNMAKGKWVAFLDDDDYWFPNKLSIQLEELNQHPECQMSSTNMMIVNISGICKGIFFNKGFLPRFIRRQDILNVNYINNSSVLISKELCDKVGEFILGINEDYDYWLRALEYTTCLYNENPLVYYTREFNYKRYYK